MVIKRTHANKQFLFAIVKNYRGWMLFACLPWAIGRNLAVIPYYAAKGFGATTLRAKADAIKGLPRMLAKRWRKAPSRPDVARFINTWASVPLPVAEIKGRARVARGPY